MLLETFEYYFTNRCANANILPLNNLRTLVVCKKTVEFSVNYNYELLLLRKINVIVSLHIPSRFSASNRHKQNVYLFISI